MTISISPKSISRIIPSMMTLGNLMFGVMALIYMEVYPMEIKVVMGLYILSMMCDALDGFLARLLGADGDFGLQLDSLVDVISFGVVPASAFVVISQDFLSLAVVVPLAFFYIACGVLRLAFFNVKKSNLPRGFIGLPIPIAAGLFLSYALLIDQLSPAYAGFFLAVVVLVPSVLMVSKLNYFKTSQRNLRNPFFALTWMIFLVILAYDWVFALPFLFTMYGILGWISLIKKLTWGSL